MGGAARLDALTSYIESFSQVQNRPQGEATITTKTIWSFPDRVRQERTMALQGKTMASATIVSPEGMWFVGGAGQAYPMPAVRPAQPRTGIRTASDRAASARRNPAFKAVALGTAQVDGVKVDKVRIISGAIDITLALDASGNGRIRAATFRDRNNEGEVRHLYDLYSDFRPIEGLQLPFTHPGDVQRAAVWTAVGDDRLDRDQCAASTRRSSRRSPRRSPGDPQGDP